MILSIASLWNTYFVLRRKVSCILRFPNRCGILYRCKLVQYPLGKFHRNHRLSHSRNCTYHHCHNHQMMHSFVPLNRLYEFYAKNIFINYWSLVLSNLTQKHDRPRLSDGSSPILTTVGETTGEKYEQCFFDHFYFDRFSRMTSSYESSSCLVLLPPPPPVASSNLSVLTILKFSWNPWHLSII